MENPRKCDVHEEESIQLFCLDCDDLVCRECIITVHAKHDFLKIEDAIRNTKQSLEGLLKRVEEEVLPSLSKEIEIVRQRKDDYSMNIDSKQKKIQEKSASLKAKIDDVTSELEQEVRKKQEEDENKWNQILSNIESKIERIKAEFEESKASLKIEDVEVICRYKSLESLLQDNIEMEDIHPLVIVSQKVDRKRLAAVIGKIQTPESRAPPPLLENLTVRGCTYAMTGVRHVSEFVNKFGWITNPTNPCQIDQITLNGGSMQFKKKLKCDEKSIVTGLALSADETLYITTFSSQVILFVKKGGNKLKRFIDLVHYQPYGLCVTCTNEIAVCIVEIEEHSKENFFNRRAKLLIFSESGQVQQTIETHNQRRLFHFPKFVAENKNGDLCVSDVTNKDEGQIVVVDADGNFRFQYEARDILPTEITCDSECRIIFADKRNDAIHILDRDGHFITKIKLKVEGMSEPSAISMFDEGHLFVGCMNSKIFVLKYCE